MSVEAFGQKLRVLRKQWGLTQAELARQCAVSQDLISIWERAYRHRGRTWKPDRASVVRLVAILADLLSPAEAQRWVALLGYKLGQTELEEIFPAYTGQTGPVSSTIGSQTNLKRLVLPPAQHLFGVSQAQQRLRRVLEQAEDPWLIAIDGIGGIGKTSLANALVREVMPAGRFHDLAWVSAKQEEFLPGFGLQSIDRPALDVNTLTNALLEQLGRELPLARPAEEKLAMLSDLLARQPYLIVIDNLETVADYQALLPLLRRLANPGKFLLTSRYSLRAHTDAYSLSLTEFNQADALAFLRYEADMRGQPALARASQAQLESIYEVTGGNPLALKLVVGQICVLSLSEVLANLKQARGKKNEALYHYIYRRAWQMLDPAGQTVLLIMPLAQGGTIDQLVALSELEIDVLQQALERLTTLSLVEVSGDLDQRRYRIHRLTETFLLMEVVRWQALVGED